VATSSMLPVLPEKARYLKFGAYPKYGDFTRLTTEIASNLTKFT
jgi:hypothetical protein